MSHADVERETKYLLNEAKCSGRFGVEGVWCPVAS